MEWATVGNTTLTFHPQTGLKVRETQGTPVRCGGGGGGGASAKEDKNFRSYTALCILLENKDCNRTTVILIRAHLEEGSKNWDIDIPLLAGAMHGKANSQTGFTTHGARGA